MNIWGDVPIKGNDDIERFKIYLLSMLNCRFIAVDTNLLMNWAATRDVQFMISLRPDYKMSKQKFTHDSNLVQRICSDLEYLQRQKPSTTGREVDESVKRADGTLEQNQSGAKAYDDVDAEAKSTGMSTRLKTVVSLKRIDGTAAPLRMNVADQSSPTVDTGLEAVSRAWSSVVAADAGLRMWDFSATRSLVKLLSCAAPFN